MDDPMVEASHDTQPAESEHSEAMAAQEQQPQQQHETNADPATVAALATLLRPGVDLSAHITKVLAEQQRLNAQIDFLNSKLSDATAQSPEDRSILLQVDAYVQKLRAARRRVATLQTSLEGTRGRLLRVHGHLKANANVMERQNRAVENTIEQELGGQGPSSPVSDHQ
jgi:chromosome segregation ATPase